MNRISLKSIPLKWWIVIGAVVLVKLFSLKKDWVEAIYSTGIYPLIARLFRLLFGWIPISVGDIIYLLAGLWLLWKLVRFSAKLFTRKLKKVRMKQAFWNGIYYLLVIYLVFNLAWGLNYNRAGAASRLGLETFKYDSTELKAFSNILLEKVNSSKTAWMNTDQPYPGRKEMFDRTIRIYEQAESAYPFLQFSTSSLKPSLYSLLGNYFGFTGYYNPFSGEAQVNTTVPHFIQPFTTAHEVAHQLGYAKENEASFVAYLAISAGNDELFSYSCYLDMFVFARRELHYFDSTAAKALTEKLIPEVRSDLEEWRRFTRQFKNPIEPFIHWAYGHYLKMNDQPQGILTYDEVIGNLMAFYRKFGKL